MAEEEVKLESIDNEEAQLKAELDRLKRESQPPPPEEAKAAEPIPEAEVDPAQARAKADEVAVETAAPEVKPKPADDDREARTKGRAFQLLRQREKELAEAQAELARVKAQEKAPKEPSFDEQPADYLLKEINATKAELARVKAEEQRRNYIDDIKRQEEQYVRQKPDYYKATEYLVEKDIKQWERAGLSKVHTNQVLQAAASNDPRYAGYKQQIDRLIADPGVQSYAEQQGIDPDEAAAYVIARDTWLSNRRDALVEGAKAQGKSVAEIAYEEAVDRGWSANAKGASADEQKEAAARARVQQAKEVAAATHSLSESASAEAGPEVRVLKNRQQIIDLDDETLDNLIKSGKYRELQ